MRDLLTSNSPIQASCPNCWKSPELCVCSETPLLQARLQFLILQHPREAKNPLGSARLLSLALPTTVHRVGLSWRSLGHALGEKTANPLEWAVLYVGTAKDSGPPKTNVPFEIRDRKGANVKTRHLKGIVLLDGNWKQAKTLWWRNPWLLKLNRVLLNPAEVSRYGSLRKQPRARCLSTLEAGVESLKSVGEKQAAEALLSYFEIFLGKLAQRRVTEAPTRKPPKPAPPPASAEL